MQVREIYEEINLIENALAEGGSSFQEMLAKDRLKELYKQLKTYDPSK